MLYTSLQVVLLLMAASGVIAAVKTPRSSFGLGNARWVIGLGATGLLAMALFLPDNARHGHLASTLIWSVFFCGLVLSRWMFASREAQR